VYFTLQSSWTPGKSLVCNHYLIGTKRWAHSLPVWHLLYNNVSLWLSFVYFSFKKNKLTTSSIQPFILAVKNFWQAFCCISTTIVLMLLWPCCPTFMLAEFVNNLYYKSIYILCQSAFDNRPFSAY